MCLTCSYFWRRFCRVSARRYSWFYPGLPFRNTEEESSKSCGGVMICFRSWSEVFVQGPPLSVEGFWKRPKHSMYIANGQGGILKSKLQLHVRMSMPVCIHRSWGKRGTCDSAKSVLEMRYRQYNQPYLAPLCDFGSKSFSDQGERRKHTSSNSNVLETRKNWQTHEHVWPSFYFLCRCLDSFQENTCSSHLNLGSFSLFITDLR